MKIRILIVLAVIGSMIFAIDARGMEIGLFEYAFNINGTVTDYQDFPPVLSPPPEVNDSGFDYSTGLGTISFSISTTGDHFVGLFVDHEIDENSNTFYNEFGTAIGAAPAGLSWEIDEPGYFYGDIYDNFLTGALDNSNGVPGGSPDDVSMALGWNFSLNSGEIAAISFDLSAVAPSSGFYLAQTESDSEASVYFSSALIVSGNGGGINAVPDSGSTILMFLLVLPAIFFWHRQCCGGARI